MRDFYFVKIVMTKIRFLKMGIRKKTLFIFLPSIRRLSRFLTISNNVTSKQDGVGAQVQRLLAIASLSKLLEIPFVQKDFQEVAVHPLDPYQSQKNYKEFIDNLNFYFKFEQKGILGKKSKNIEIESLSLVRLFFLSVYSMITKSRINLEILAPYKIVDLFPESYLKIRSQLTNFYESKPKPQGQKYLVIHYRQGVGGKVIYPGQKISRELDEAYFLNVIDNHALVDFSTISCIVLTDAPLNDTEYEVPENQRYLWENTPNYLDGTMYIKGHSFPMFKERFKKLEIVRGGDPIEALQWMAHADLLFLSRSSLSYLGGILNEYGAVYAEGNFWHPPLPKWKLSLKP